MPSVLRPLIAELLQAAYAQDPARFHAQSRRVFKSARGSEPGELTAAIGDLAPYGPYGWSYGRAYPRMTPRLTLDAVLDEAEAAEWLGRIAPAVENDLMAPRGN